MPKLDKTQIKQELLKELIDRYGKMEHDSLSGDVYLQGCQTTINKVIIDLQHMYLATMNKQSTRNKKLIKIT